VKERENEEEKEKKKTENALVTGREIQRLAAIQRPIVWAVEGPRVPHDLFSQCQPHSYLSLFLYEEEKYLQHDLRDLDGVALGAFRADVGERDGPADGVGDVVAVVGAVEVLSVPASAANVSYFCFYLLFQRSPDTSR
jgi:hypothetical protein